MNAGQNQGSTLNEVKEIAKAEAYTNVPQLKQDKVEITDAMCRVTRMPHGQQNVVGPGEAINEYIQDEEWEVIILLKVYSQLLKIIVSRYPDGGLAVSSFDALPH